MTPFLAEIAAIKADTTSGSLRILDRTMDAIRYLVQLEDITRDALLITLKQALDELLEIHGQLMVMRHFASEVHAFLKTTEPGGNLSMELSMFVEGYARQWGNAELSIAGQFTQTADPHSKTLLLHSQSTTICRLFDHFKENNVKVAVVQTESRPRLEGRYTERRHGMQNGAGPSLT